MSGHFYLIRYENKLYANNELYIAAIAKGEKALLKLLSKKALVGKELMDQIIYPLTPAEQITCRDYNPTVQDFDDAVRHFNVVSKTTLKEMLKGESIAFSYATVINIKRRTLPQTFAYKHLEFFKVMDYKEGQKYRMLSKMAAVRICGRLYIALVD